VNVAPEVDTQRDWSSVRRTCRLLHGAKHNRASPPHVDPSQRLRSNSKIALLAPSGHSPIAGITWSGIALHAVYSAGYPASHGCIEKMTLPLDCGISPNAVPV
jgi:hypothetical protein